MKVELGKRYVTNGGDVTGPLEWLKDSIADQYPYWDADNGRGYNEAGEYLSGYPNHTHSLAAVWHGPAVEPTPVDDDNGQVAIAAPVTESICDADQQQVRNTIIRRADEARITGFATAALQTTREATFNSDEAHAKRAWHIADAMEAEWQKRFGR